MLDPELDDNPMAALLREAEKSRLAADSPLNKRSKEQSDEPRNLGLHARQSSYANLHLTVQAQEPQKPKHSEEANVKKNNDDENNPKIVLTADDDDDDDDAPIGLSVRQPSFASLKGHIVPKGGVEGGQMPLLIEEEEPNKSANDDDDDHKEGTKLGMHARQSSYARLHLTVNQEEKAPDLMALIEEKPQETHEEQDPNPIIVMTGDDDDDEDDDAPIGLSVRQPSFSSLHGNVIPKGGFDPKHVPLAIQEESGDNDKEEVKEQHSHEHSVHRIENPIIVLTGNDDEDDAEDDDNDTPIGLSVRQPSFSSLHGNVIPKGGFDPVNVPLAIEEEPEPEPKPKPENDQPQQSSKKLSKSNEVGSKARKSSYTNLHFDVTPKKEQAELLKIVEEKPKRKEEKVVLKENPIIVLTGNDDDEDDEDNDAPIGLSVRQPSFSSLHGNVIPKGGFDPVNVPLAIEEEPEGVEQEQEPHHGSKLSKKNDSGENYRQSSYTHLHLTIDTNDPKEALQNEPIQEETDDAQKHQEEEPNNNPVIVLTADSDEGKNDAPIGLSVRQPSFSNLHGNVIPKGGYGSSIPLIEEIPENPDSEQPKEESNSILKREKTQEEIVESLNQFNKEWWDEIGYKPHKPDQFHRNSSMITLQQNKIEPKPKTNMIKGTSTFFEKKTDKPVNIFRGPSLVRVNSFGNKAETKVVEMPKETNYEQSNDDALEVIQSSNSSNYSEASKQSSDNDQINQLSQSEQSSNVDQIKHLSQSEQSYQSSNSSTPLSPQSNQSDQSPQSSNIPSHHSQNSKQPKKNISNISNNSKPHAKKLVRVNSFGNKKETMVVEMPNLAESYETNDEYSNNDSSVDNQQDQTHFSKENRSQQNSYNASSGYEQDQEYDNDSSVNCVDENGVPIRIIRLKKNIYENNVYDALAGSDDVAYLSREKISIILRELRRLLNVCVDSGYLEESEFLSNTIERLKKEVVNVSPIFELDEKLKDLEKEFQQKLNNWQRMYEKLESERESKLQECDDNYQQQLENLEAQFKEERSKSSPPKLVSLRKSAKQMIKDTRFKESFELSKRIYMQEMYENQRVSKKLSDAYVSAKRQLKEEYENEKSGIVMYYESRKLAIAKKREQSLLPLREQMIQLKKMRSIIEESERLEINEENQRYRSTNRSYSSQAKTKKRKTSLPLLTQYSDRK